MDGRPGPDTEAAGDIHTGRRAACGASVPQQADPQEAPCHTAEGAPLEDQIQEACHMHKEKGPAPPSGLHMGTEVVCQPWPEPERVERPWPS